MPDLLAILLGLEHEDADKVRIILKSLGQDVPALAVRVEETEILVKAIASYLKEQDEHETNGMRWRLALDRAKEQVARQNAEIRTKIPK